MTELMKGHRWKDQKHKMTFPAWVEIKHDEIRCHVIVTPQGPAWDVQFMSYAGKPLHNMQSFVEGFRALARDTGILEYDCGFEVNGSYNDSYRWVRSKNGIPKELQAEGTACVFLLFDLPELKLDFANRMWHRQNVAIAARAGCYLNLVQPHGEWAKSEQDVDLMFEQARIRGFEGLMVKSTQHLYERGKRSYGWLKVKPEDDADGIIREVFRAVSIEGVPLDRVGSVMIDVDDGSHASPHGIPHELGADMWKHPEKYIGQWAEFVYMERDRQGGYRHPVFKRLREAKA